MVENRHIRRINSRQRCRDLRFISRANPIGAVIALLALIIQLFVVQTHIHDAGFASGAISQVTSSAASDIRDGAGDRTAHPDGFPVKDDPSNCPLCQVFAHSGGLLHAAQLPSWVPVFIIESAVHFSAPVQLDPRVSHSWFGRAPPRTTVQS
jgi:hypothetical protein